ncbi:unnamed protein product [Rotaria sordida]|uniref:Uncharacterized protein n=1 Tax=Rotaria sordida TaxID=392033 RepID=A0A818KX91_9BILA|nr:unnamed protein product [Rotaria sordida]
MTLVTLYFGNSHIGDLGAQHLADMLRNNTLDTQCSNLEGNEIGIHGIQHLTNTLQYNTTLVTLYLGNNRIQALGAQHLADVLPLRIDDKISKHLLSSKSCKKMF